MNFKPSKWKIIVSVIFILVWIIFNNWSIRCSLCSPLAPKCEGDYHGWMLLTNCICDCVSLKTMILSNLINVIIPFILVYIILSLFEKNKKRKK